MKGFDLFVNYTKNCILHTIQNAIKTMSKEDNKLVIFQEKEIRRTWHNEEWWFSVIDVVGAISESKNHRRYWSDLKRRL